MAMIEDPTSGALLAVGANASSPAHVALKPIPRSGLGVYAYSGVTGTIAAALAANAQLWYVRWTDATRLMVIHHVRVEIQPLTLFTAATLTDFGFDLVKATSISGGGGGTDIFGAVSVPTKMRTGMATSLLAAVSSMRIATTGALTALTTLDTYPIAQSLGDTQRVNPAAATEEQRVNEPLLEWRPSVADGHHPLILAQNEGLVLRNRTVWPAAGTAIVKVSIGWSEVDTY